MKTEPGFLVRAREYNNNNDANYNNNDNGGVSGDDVRGGNILKIDTLTIANHAYFRRM